jgi:RNA polymerase sigma-70 factor (ECF subfamily)
LKNYKGKAPFLHWISRIATYVGYKYWKKKSKDKEFQTLSSDEIDQLNNIQSDDVEPSQASEILHNLLEKLPPRDRLVLTLRYLDDKNIEETAQLTGWSKTMVKVQTLRAKKKLLRLFNLAIRNE